MFRVSVCVCVCVCVSVCQCVVRSKDREVNVKSVLGVKLSQQQRLRCAGKGCDRCSEHSRDAEEVESHCSPA